MAKRRRRSTDPVNRPLSAKERALKMRSQKNCELIIVHVYQYLSVCFGTVFVCERLELFLSLAWE